MSSDTRKTTYSNQDLSENDRAKLETYVKRFVAREDITWRSTEPRFVAAEHPERNNTVALRYSDRTVSSTMNERYSFTLDNDRATVTVTYDNITPTLPRTPEWLREAYHRIDTQLSRRAISAERKAEQARQKKVRRTIDSLIGE